MIRLVDESIFCVSYMESAQKKNKREQVTIKTVESMTKPSKNNDNNRKITRVRVCVRFFLCRLFAKRIEKNCTTFKMVMNSRMKPHFTFIALAHTDSQF